MRKRLKAALGMLMVLSVLLTYSVPSVSFAEADEAVQQEDGAEIVFAVSSQLLGSSAGKWTVKAVKEWNYPGASKWPCKKWMAYNSEDPEDEIVAYCLQPDLDGPVSSVGGKHSYADSDVTNTMEADVKKCLYYCYGYPGWDELKAVIDDKMKGTDFSPSKDGFAASSQYYMCCHILLALFYYDNTSSSSKAFDGIDTDGYAKERDAFRAVYDKVKSFDSIPTGDMGIRLKKGNASYTSGTVNISSSEMKYYEKAHDMTVSGVDCTVPAGRFVTPVITVECNPKDRIKVKIIKDSRMRIVRGDSLLNRKYGDYDSAYIDDSNFTQLKDGDRFWYEVNETRTESYSGTVRSINQSFQPVLVKCTDKQTLTFAATESKDTVKLSMDFPTGAIRIYKKDDGAWPQTENNPAYDLSGAQFSIKYEGEPEMKVTLDTPSESKPGQYYILKKGLHFGSYDIKEIKAPEGYELNDSKVTLTVDREYKEASDAVQVTIKETPELKPFSLAVEKVDSETGKPLAQAGSLKGAVYEICYSRTEKADPEMKWYLETDENGEAFFSEEYLAEGYAGNSIYMKENKSLLPYGYLKIKEIKAPQGYEVDRSVQTMKLGEGTKATFAYTSEEPVIRGDFELKKTEMFTGRPMEGVVFRLTNLDTGESHIVVTDENGEYSSVKNKNTERTNANDLAVKDNDGKSYIEESELSPECGIWFGEPSAAADDKGALIYGNYELVELSTTANRAKILVLPMRFDISMQGEVETAGSIENKGMMIKTHASDAVTGDHDGFAGENQVLIDTLEYAHAEPGTEYTVVTTLKNAKTGEAIYDDGEEARAETTFRPESEEGTLQVRIIADTEGMNLQDVVIFENIYYTDKNGEVKEAAFEENLNNREQTVTLHVPGMGTTAQDQETGEHLSNADEKVTIVDRVSYTGLITGKEYTVKGVLMDKKNGDPVMSEGKEVTAEARFIPEEPDGTIDMTFEFDGTALAGSTLVAFESIELNETEVISHMDISDVDQTIYLPGLETTAQDQETGEHLSNADEKVTIVDTVSYTNLIAGKEYTVKGVLMDKKSGSPVMSGGKEVTSEARFVPEEPDGTVDMIFTFDGSALAGKTLVAFESIEHNEKEIASHADITDEEQTIYLPEVGTTASKNKKETSVTDVVEYKNLVPGKKYIVSGVMMDKKNGKPVLSDGKEITGEVSFVPENKDGKTEVKFDISKSDLKGKDIVIFETVYAGKMEEENMVAEHKDMNSKSQTVSFPAGTMTKPHVAETGLSQMQIALLVLFVISAAGLIILMQLRRKEGGE